MKYSFPSLSLLVISRKAWLAGSAASIAPAFIRPVVIVPLAMNPMAEAEVIKRLLSPLEPGRVTDD